MSPTPTFCRRRPTTRWGPGSRRPAGGRIYVESDLAALDGHRSLIEAVTGWGGGLDVLVNNAGIGSPRRGDLLSLTPENFDRVMGANLRGTFFLSQRVAAWMAAHPRGDGFRRSIVTIGSVSAEMASPERGRILRLQGRARHDDQAAGAAPRR